MFNEFGLPGIWGTLMWEVTDQEGSRLNASCKDECQIKTKRHVILDDGQRTEVWIANILIQKEEHFT
ncbi:hypothetical protein FOVG_03800 [Fusarium oxysporum f. sp. pisi HDV247]|uniref:Uncharacterized protein n=2 Tax=Fusarium oxysporum TaxID=5507 RepID=X0KP25_FUSOX|nr:hypothetical protein FOVG_03800 [Fusarium oxysporum f. sp. pisi HDV247]EXM15293.1 hypothetical protein FOTG_16371 [Fusarium oxysporum f. sp. vasinfectum 25433]